MIIKQLNIYGFGRWIDQQIDIQNPLQVVYGPNEAGKSTIIAFIKGLLFGFTDKKHSIHGQYQPKGNAPYGGEIIFSVDGHDYKLVRTGLKYGGTVKFYDLDADTELTDEDYEELISPIDRTAYDQLFYFGNVDQGELYKMGRDELRMRIQSIGVAGAGEWMALQADLDKQSAKLYAPRGRTKTINVQIAEYKALEKQVTDAKEDFPKYQQLQATLKGKREGLSKLKTTLKENDHELDEKRHIQTVLPLVNQLSQYNNLKASQLRKGFSNDDLNTFNQLNLQVDNLKQQLAEKQQGIDELAAQLSVSPAQQFYEDHRDVINQLGDQLPEERKRALQIEMTVNQMAESQQQIDEKASLIEKNDQGHLPKVFDMATFPQVNELLRDRQNLSDKLADFKDNEHRRSQQANQSNNQGGSVIWYGAAIALVVAAFLLNSTSFGWIGYVLAIVAAVWGWYSAKKSPVETPVQNMDDPVELKKQLAQIEANISKIRNQFELQGIDESNWISIQGPLQQILDLNTNYQKQKTALAVTQAQYNHYLEKWQFAGDWLKFDQTRYSETIETINTTVQHWQELSAVYHRKKLALDEAQKSIQTVQSKFTKSTEAKAKFLEDRGIQSDEAFKASVETQTALSDKLRRKADLEKQIEAANIQIPKDIDQGQLDDDIKDMSVKTRQIRDQVDDLSREATQISTEIEGLVKNGKYYDLRQSLANKQTEIVENVQKYFALKLSSEWIQSVLDIASKGRLPKTLELAKKYFSTLTDGAYKEIIFKNEISVVRNDDVHFPINELSTGTLEQLYLALIFSMSVGFSDQYPMPIMIDDGFVNFDKNRKSAAGKMLQQISEKIQVIYFTANLDENTDMQLVLDLNKL